MKSLTVLLVISGGILSGCASNSAADAFAADNCRALTTLFNDQNLNAEANVSGFDTDPTAEKSKDKLTWPWGTGGRDEDKVSKERAALRQAHNRKGCAH